eukprot:m51a1_g8730 hypothetical protein (329) ;mRNA; f:9155-11285
MAGVKQRALYIGRFQPFHSGHEDVLKQIIEAGYGSVVVVVGSSTSPESAKNPFGAEERAAMIAPAMRALGLDGRRVVAVPDIHDPPNYAAHVCSCVSRALGEPVDSTNTTIVCSTNEYTVDCFTKYGQSFAVFKTAHRVAISATQVRDMMHYGGPWDAFLPAGTAEAVRSFRGVERVCRLLGGKPHRNPTPTADVVIEAPGGGIVLIERVNPPLGWALPGGFVEYGEDVWDAARREALEETSLDCAELALMNVYGRPDRDPRSHTQTTVFVGTGARGTLKARDDARRAAVFTQETLPADIAFDHRAILRDYFELRRQGKALPFSKKYA